MMMMHPLLWWQTNCPHLHFGSSDHCDFSLLAKVCRETDKDPNCALCKKTLPFV